MSWKRVTRDEWLKFIEQFPERQSYRTGIIEPPKEICEYAGRTIATVTYGDWIDGKPDWNAKVFEIDDAVTPPSATALP